MAEPTTSRWPTVTGLWIGVATWLYAALATYEVWSVTRGGLAPFEDELEPAPALAESLVGWTTGVLGLALVVAVVSLVTCRVRRLADLLLALGLGLGAVLLWAAGTPERPGGPLLVGTVAAVVLVSVPLPARPAEGRVAGFLARLVVATVALLLGWVCAHELDKHHWTVSSSVYVVYWVGLAVAAAMVLVALLGPLLGHPVARWVFGLPTLLLGLGVLVLGGMLMEEGRQLVGHPEDESAWHLAGAPVFLATGLVASGLALLRRRPTLATGTVAAAVLTVLGLVFAIPDYRNFF